MLEDSSSNDKSNSLLGRLIYELLLHHDMDMRYRPGVPLPWLSTYRFHYEQADAAPYSLRVYPPSQGQPHRVCLQ